MGKSIRDRSSCTTGHAHALTCVDASGERREHGTKDESALCRRGDGRRRRRGRGNRCTQVAVGRSTRWRGTLPREVTCCRYGVACSNCPWARRQGGRRRRSECIRRLRNPDVRTPRLDLLPRGAREGTICGLTSVATRSVLSPLRPSRDFPFFAVRGGPGLLGSASDVFAGLLLQLQEAGLLFPFFAFSRRLAR